MSEHPINGLMQTTMQKIKEMLSFHSALSHLAVMVL